MRKLWVLLGISVLLCPVLGWAASTAKSDRRGSAAVAHKTVMNRWSAESLSGTVSMVDPQKDLLVVRDSSGTPFDFVVTRSTHIRSGAQKEKLPQLSANEPVSIRFIPESRGDVAQKIDVGR